MNTPLVEKKFPLGQSLQIVQGDITTQTLEIRATGRVWGDVIATTVSAEEGAFLRGQIRLEETVELD